MGWFWGDSKDDPVKKLDPGLRDYLERETPAQQNYVPKSETQTPYPPEAVKDPSQPPSPDSSQSDDSKVPAASLFPDGRYAHIWKNYKPPADADRSPVKGAEKVIQKVKDHRDSVHRAAMENCALEHEDLSWCMKTGNWQKRLYSRVTMCSDENHTWSRCFTTQAKFLQALGYASSFDHDPEREERIQMHGDKLYHQMLDFEKRVEDARAAGQEPPPIKSLFNPGAKTRQEMLDSKVGAVDVPGDEPIPAGFQPSKEFNELSPHERELEIRAYKSHMDQHKVYIDRTSPFMKGQEDAKEKRKEKASSWLGETVAKWIT